MPNWCMNKVKMSGEIGKEVSEHISLGRGYFFSHYVPAEDTIEDHCNKWDTKWDVPCDEIDIYIDGDTVTLEFLTAWSPPISFFDSLASMYDGNVLLKYAESGMGYIGMWDSTSPLEFLEWEMDDPSVPCFLKESFQELYETN